MLPATSSSVDGRVALLPSPPAITVDPLATTVDPERFSRRMKWGVAGLAAVGCAYVAIADPNKSTVLPPCPFKSMTGLDCPGCGITRALHALLHGNVVRALDHNVMFVVALIVGLVWFGWRRLQSALGREVKPFRFGPGASIALGLGVAAFWVVRNIPWGPLYWLRSGATGV